MLYPNGEFSISLSSSTLVKSHKPPKAVAIRMRGMGQTTYSKRMVRNCIYRLESQHGKHNLAFATYTLPGVDDFQLCFIQQWWSEMVRQLIQAINRKLEKAGIEPQLVHVTEIQTKRLTLSGQAVPHLHVVFQSRKNRYSSYAISKEENTEMWGNIVNNFMAKFQEETYLLDMRYAADIQTIKKSAENYMAKYMSKCTSTIKRIPLTEHLWQPKSWWGATLTLRDWVKANTKILSDKAKKYIKNSYKFWEENPNLSPMVHMFVVMIEGKVDKVTKKPEFYPVAIVGKIKRNYLNRFETKDLNTVNPFSAVTAS